MNVRYVCNSALPFPTGEAVISMLESLEAKDALVQQLDSVSHLKVGRAATCVLRAAARWAVARTLGSVQIDSQGAAAAKHAVQGRRVLRNPLPWHPTNTASMHLAPCPSYMVSLIAKPSLSPPLSRPASQVSAWHCAQCEQLFEFQDKQCRADGHVLTRTSTLKRFWSCDHCNARITTLGVRFPNSRCSRCVADAVREWGFLGSLTSRQVGTCQLLPDADGAVQ